MPFVIRPSEIRTFLDCQRKWAFKREELGGIVDVSSIAQEFGTALHKLQENYLLKNEPHPDTPMGNLARLSIPWLPTPGEQGLKVEQRIVVPGNTGWIFQGTPDVRLSVKGRDPSFLFDHKTTSNFKYALSEEALKNDSQLIIYGAATLEESGASTLVARWIYSLKGDAPAVKIREIVVPKKHFDEKLIALRAAGDIAVEAIKEKANPLDLEPNFKACKAYGGCPHRLACGVPMSDYEKERMENKMATDRLKALLAAKKAAQPTPEATAELEPVLAEGINPPDAAEPVLELPPEPVKEKKTRAKKEKAEDVILTYEPKDFQEMKITKHLTVYADCLPVKGEYSSTNFRDLVSEAEKFVAETYGVPDYRMVDYGKGPGALVAALKKGLEGLSGDILADLSSPSQRLCFDALCEAATDVIRGVR